jgi:ankyrin repeat protein
MRYLSVLFPFLLAAQPAADKGRLLLESIHKGDAAAIRAALKSGADANTRDEMGATALMHAAAYASLDSMRELVAAGADVNAVSSAGFTPVMWAVHDPARLRLLISKGADVNARAKDGNTAMILARQNAITDAVPILLKAGAKDEDGMDAVSRPAVTMSRDLVLQNAGVGLEPMHMVGRFTPAPLVLTAFLAGGTAEPIRGMLDAGAPIDGLIPFGALSLPPISFSASQGNVDQVRELLNRGANPNAVGSRNIMPLMAAASADVQSPEIIRMLLAKGAKVDARDDSGWTALDWALRQGETEVAKVLRDAGAKPMAEMPHPSPIDTPRSPATAVEKAVALLQPIGPNFFKSSGGCISCHNNSLPGIAARMASERKVAVDATLVGHAEKAAIATWSPVQENLAVGASSVAGLIANVSYELFAMAEAGSARNFVTDAASLALLRLQHSNGTWSISDCRPPIGISDIKWAALVSRSLLAYLPPGLSKDRDRAITAARAYLMKTPPRSTQDAAFRVLGLQWTNASSSAIRDAKSHLLSLQREDGGWGQLTTMAPDAYATGQALFALKTAGVAPSDAAYRRGVAYLLRTQMPDGSWFVQSRALAFQPYRETGFPYGRSQFISAAATSWAVMALAPAIDAPKQTAQATLPSSAR